MNLNDMTLDVLSTIYGFLPYKDKLNIILVSKLIFNELQQCRSFQLNLKSSMKYCLDELFREKILQLVKYPSKYLSLSLNSNAMAYNPHVKNIYSLIFINCNIDLNAILEKFPTVRVRILVYYPSRFIYIRMECSKEVAHEKYKEMCKCMSYVNYDVLFI